MRSIFPQRRYHCKKCNFHFSERNRNFGVEKHPLWIRKKILGMWSMKKSYINKYDNLRKETYSTREIAKRFDVSPSFVHRLVNEQESKHGIL